MFQLALACIVIGIILVVFFLAGVMNAPIVKVGDWVGGLGFGLVVAGLVFAVYGALGWMGWGVPRWLIWGTGICGALVLAVSWIGTFGDPIARSPLETYPFLVIIGSGVLAAAIVAGFAC